MTESHYKHQPWPRPCITPWYSMFQLIHI